MDKFQKFIQDLFKDRAGSDELSLFLSVLGLICIVGAGAFSYPYVEVVLTALGIAFLVLSIYRVFSKDKSKRYQENYKFKSLFNSNSQKKSEREAAKAKKKALKEKEKLINRSKKKKYTEEDYLYEVQVLDPNIKRLKSIIRNLKFRRNRNVFKLKRKMPSVCFGGKKNLRSDLETFRFKVSVNFLYDSASTWLTLAL